tara:strand:+ start:1039 stop:1320 length:282 start_codon:yes stop_codon:yes gene_type:complete
MLFVIIGTDKPDSLPLRMANRDAHLKYWADSGVVKMGGPFSNDEGTVMNGSLLAIDVENRAAAEKLLANDPYNLAGLFGHAEIRAWKWLLGAN